jgi:hypothetical protein
MDIVIGAITRYSYDQIKYWINSLNRSGFSGEKYLLCSGIDSNTTDQIQNAGITVALFDMKPHENIVVSRFWAYWNLLIQLNQNENEHDPYRYVIATDVKDVIFQTNPSDWLSRYAWGNLILSSESLNYEDEPWGMNNITQAFGPTIASHYKKAGIVNCGVQAGEFSYMKDLFLAISLLCSSRSPYTTGGGGPDQAALNILSNMNPYIEDRQVTTPWDGWAAQLGTTGDPSKIESFKPKLIHGSHSIPVYQEGQFVTPKKAQSPYNPYAIVHQWDRMDLNIVNELKEKYS